MKHRCRVGFLLIALAAIRAQGSEPDVGVGTVEDFVFSPDGRSLIVLGSKGAAVVEPSTFEVRHRVTKPVPPSRILFSFDGETVALAPCETYLVSLKEMRPAVQFECDGKARDKCVQALIFSPSKPEVWTACPDGKLTRRSSRDGKVLADAASVPSPVAKDVLGQLMNTARIVPAYRQGAAYGFKLFAIKPDSFWEKAGFKNGDVLMRVGDSVVTHAEDSQRVLRMLVMSEVPVSLEVDRAGQRVKLQALPLPKLNEGIARGNAVADGGVAAGNPAPAAK